MSEILLTPVPEPVSPIDPDMRMKTRAPSQSTEFFNSLYVEGVRGFTKPLQLKKKTVVAEGGGRTRTSTVSVPSSPTSFRFSASLPPAVTSADPHQSISDLFMAMDLKRNASVSEKSVVHLALDTTNHVQPGPSPPLTPYTPVRRRKTSFPLTPVTPGRPVRRVPASPVTPTRAPSKAMKLLGTAPPAPPPKQGRRKRDHFRPLPTSTLNEINQFFGNVPKKPLTKASVPTSTSVKRLGSGDRKVGSGSTVQHRGEDGTMWLDIEEEQEFAWLMTDPSASRRLPTSESSDDDGWGMKAFSSVLAPSAKSSRTKAKPVEESFNDMFSAKSKPKPRKQANRPVVPHPWSAAALAADEASIPPVPTLVPRQASDSSSSSSGPPTPDSDTSPLPPRRPKHRPPPLVLDLRPKAGLPIVLNSPVIPMPIGTQRRPLKTAIASPIQPRMSVMSAQTPFVHPRRAPIPKSIGLGHPPLPRMTDTRMPLLPPIELYNPDEELQISCFEPDSPTDAKYSGHGRSGSNERRGWLKKVRDFSHGRV